jgi:predicted acyltransferase
MENESKPAAQRLQSLDALRGFDMFWIMGGKHIFLGLATLTGWPVLEWWATQMKHTPWHGFTFYDMIFPLFLFIAGISFPYSLAKRRATGESDRIVYIHIVKRGLILVFIGILYSNGVNFDFANMTYRSVLGIIGLAWMFAALIYIRAKMSFRIIWFLVLLLGYWLTLMMFPAHDLGSHDRFSPEGNLTGYIERLVMPGPAGNSEQLFSVIPAIGTALLGMFTGEFMRSGYLKDKPLRKTGCMVLAALALILTGKVWDIVFPINKHLWTSSFACFAGGLSLLLFFFFHLIIEIWKFKKWAFVLIVIGLNPITIYLGRRIIDFKYTAGFFFDGIAAVLPESWAKLVSGVGLTTVCWVFLYFLYKKKIFLKV